uniref:MYND-type domain-containing protein n=1 Tax=Chromera velia CCMP2878 TaxID=1169474 RepID=A0A0G4FRJ2_9ALVE|mmetsp:Transcript_34805/g.68720  ORF Transcript_34805/g.68720 Transcript_34805/m.68720 type:complete len:379 (+) Transcript_34805:121-1257(+)|eukprot:Cvel_18407.t1-p1 / transcript=Cvel_18407.t1 / gene=Cvel_18407 / organism=Chromera_velia_CCMP2878 / gene_product=hypothetical protein / transcript_product=hypothetical protein / location=Cvel_scaffold1522:27581-28714(+) / protein_length=378 / sequence_SO=supercontig / SO=protein_coding / is_pseudo=false
MSKTNSTTTSKPGRSVRWPGGKARVGEVVYFGGSMNFIASASLPRKEDRAVPTRDLKGSTGPRQKATSAALLAVVREGTFPFSTRVAARLNDEINRGLHGDDGTSLSFPEHAFLRLHYFAVSILKADVLRVLVETVREVKTKSVWFQEEIDSASGLRFKLEMSVFMRGLNQLPALDPTTRMDVLALLEYLLRIPPGSNCLIFSEPDNQVVPLQMEVKDPEEVATSGDEDKLLRSDSMFATLERCFWCGRSGARCSLLKCGKCRKLPYCSVECQKMDWMGFHKGEECASLMAKDATRTSIGLEETRDQFLHRDGAQRACLPLPVGMERVAGPGKGGVFEGDAISIYLCSKRGMNGMTPMITKDNFLHPHGFKLQFREFK